MSRNREALGLRSTSLSCYDSKIISLKASIHDVKEVAKENMEKVIERDIKLQALHHQIDNLKEQTSQFRSNATKLRRQQSHRRMKLIILSVAIMVSLALAFMIYGSK